LIQKLIIWLSYAEYKDEGISMKMAIVGCGAIAEFGHLPALALAKDVEAVLLVDRDVARAKAMADRFGIRNYSADISDVAKTADAACVALPHHLHEPIGTQLLNSGVHVLIEKPLAMTTAECDSLIDAASRAGRVLSVAMMRRYSPSNMLAKALLTNNSIGQIRSFHIESGSAEIWPARSQHLLSRRDSGGGALMSNGCHDLDLVTWLLGPVATARCFSDSLNNAEANFTLNLAMESGIEGTVEVSRSRTLRNSMRIEAEHAILEFPPMGEVATIAFSGHEPVTIEARPEIGANTSNRGDFFSRVMAAQLENFAGAVNGLNDPMVSGASARTTIDLIERCYADAIAMDLPWRRPIAFANVH
jgi:predicted dehydrogenase